MSEKERKDYFERYKNVDEYDAVLRWHCRLDEPKPVPAEKKSEDVGPQMDIDASR